MSIKKGSLYIAGGGSGSSRNIGDIFYTTRTDTALSGAVECNGGTYSTADYAGAGSIGELLASGKLPYVSLTDYATQITNNGVCGVFGWDGTGTTAFRVPTLKDMFIECGQANELGDYIGAGLPNITGNFENSERNRSLYANGAFYLGAVAGGYASSTSIDSRYIEFDASRSSSIYGNSTTVQPEAIKYRAMVQLFNSTTDEAVATVGTITAQVGENTTQISDLRNMSNITATGKETIVGWGMPDYSAGINIAVPVQATPYICQTDCYMQGLAEKYPYNVFNVYINGVEYRFGRGNNTNTWQSNNISLFLPKGTSVYFTSGYVAANSLYVFPLKGVN